MTGTGAVFTGTEEDATRKAGTKLAIAGVGTLSDTEREMWETIASGPWVKIPAEIVGTEDTDRVAATVAVVMTRGTWDGTSEMIGKAKKTSSMDEENETSGGKKNENWVAGESWGEYEDLVVPAEKRSLEKVEAVARAEAQVGGKRRRGTAVKIGNFTWCWTPRTATRIFPVVESKDSLPRKNHMEVIGLR